MTRVRPAPVALVAALAALLVAPTTATPTYAAGARPAVIERRVVGHSVQGRPIVAWHLGQPDRAGVPRVLLMSTMHGDERDTQRILRALVDGAPVRGIDLWVLPVANPDGLAHHTRTNAHGVDLNRNFPHAWADLGGRYESGSRPASEPETRALMAFAADIRPQVVLSFHQPLHGVDSDPKRPGLSRAVARHLHLPRSSLTCGGVCHGTMTGWFDATFPGSMLTVEYGAHPTRRTTDHDAPGQVLAVFGAHRG